MKQFREGWIFVTLFVNLTWSIYVPEHANSNLGLDYLSEKEAFNETKAIRRALQQKVNKYILKPNNNYVDNHVQHNVSQKTSFIEQKAKNLSHQLLPILRQEKSYDINDDVDIKAKNRKTNVYKNLEAKPTGFAQQQQHNIRTNKELTEVMEENEFNNTLHHTRQRRQLSDFLIAPNTRWCGRGNIANGTYNHLGGATMADKCCRTHDHCKVYIPAMSNRFDIFNYRPYTLSHCNCDRRFRTCLKMANDEDANTIGKLFFNLVQSQCFVLVKEITCLQRANDSTCLKEHIKQKAYLRNNKKY